VKKNILFVDDDINILNGLKRMLYPNKKEWNMYFVDSGQKALKLISEQPIDIIVTDMRMPQMDGIALLTEVQKKYPEIIRIVLSGHSDKNDILKTVNLAHQFLTKPCSSEKIKNVINKTFEIIKILNNEQVKQMVSKIEGLPSLPDAYYKINEEMKKSDCSLKKVAEIISSDVSMSANILKLVNSSFFGLANHISSPTQAVNLLGLDIIKGLLISSHVFQELEMPKISGFSVKQLMNHSLLVGTLAKAIAVKQKVDKNIIDDSFIAGILHDLGKIILLSKFNITYKIVIEESKSKNITIVDAENQVLGVTHAAVGAYLLGLWGLSDAIVEAVALHHQPNYTSKDYFIPLTAVHFANYFEHKFIVINDDYIARNFDEDYLLRIGLEKNFEEWQNLSENICMKVTA
jgi:HD-like signal output (HDOD) protein